MKTLPLTVAIVTLNEADRVEAAIQSVPSASEVLVIDSGSTDGTVGLARALGARVVETDWPGHVAQKERARTLASQPWILFLDADEWTSPTLAKEVEEAVRRDGPERGFFIRRRNRWLGRPIRGGAFGPRWHLRLVRGGQSRWGGEDPHDVLTVDGPTGRLDGLLEHEPYRDLADHLGTIDRYSTRFVQMSMKRGRRARILDILVRPPWHFLRAYVFQAGVRDGVAGLQIAWIGARYVGLKWVRLWLHQRRRS